MRLHQVLMVVNPRTLVVTVERRVLILQEFLLDGEEVVVVVV
jgi:hypothetical protein